MNEFKVVYVPNNLFASDFFEEIVANIRRQHDTLLRNCFGQKGFTVNYIKEHPGEFHTRTIAAPTNSCTGYYHFDELLFKISTVYKYETNCDVPNKVEYTIYFRVEMA